MIPSIAIRAAPRIRQHLQNFLEYVHKADWGNADKEMLALESVVVQHFVSRGLACDAAKDIIRTIRYWLDRKVLTWGKQQEIEKLVRDLQKVLVKLPDDPINALEAIYYQLQDDFDAWGASRSEGDWKTVSDDLMLIRHLKPKFKTVNLPNREAVYAKYLEVFAAANQCVAGSPMAPKTERLWESLISRFSSLFRLTDELLALSENLQTSRRATTGAGCSPTKN